jgi:hypothetical protein
METYIKYKRINELVDANELEMFFDDLVKKGWEIIYYNEKEPIKTTALFEEEKTRIPITIVAGKKQNNVL